MKNIIITPTFVGHFQFITPYIKSFKKYAVGHNYLISFLISNAEKKKFSKIVRNFPSLPIEVLYFEDILQEFGITEAPDAILQKYGKFSYQTLKKFYAMLHYGKDARFLVLDSESMLINKTNMGNLFQDFFDNPFISYSYLKQRTKISPFLQRVVDNDNFLGLNNGIWCLENFVWFYEGHILRDMIKELGTPFQIINKVHLHNKGDSSLAGVFEIELYQNFIYKHRQKYKYKIVNVNQGLQNYIPASMLREYNQNLGALHVGNCGILERCTDFITNENYKYFAEFMKDNRFNIIRCDYTNLQNYPLQKAFLDIVKPNILAASQDHAFGVNNPLPILLKTAPSYIKLKKHFDRWFYPLKNFINIILVEPIKTVTHLFPVIKDIIKSEWMIHSKKD